MDHVPEPSGDVNEIRYLISKRVCIYEPFYIENSLAGIKIWIHVTPYQVQDDRRAWIRREEQTFTELLQRFGAHVSRTLHFDGATADLNMHFDILSVFRNPAKIAQKNEF